MESRKLRGMVVMNAEMYRACAISVSYTHLDVYKRQPSGTGISGARTVGVHFNFVKLFFHVFTSDLL